MLVSCWILLSDVVTVVAVVVVVVVVDRTPRARRLLHNVPHRAAHFFFKRAERTYNTFRKRYSALNTRSSGAGFTLL